MADVGTSLGTLNQQIPRRTLAHYGSGCQISSVGWRKMEGE